MLTHNSINWNNDSELSPWSHVKMSTQFLTDVSSEALGFAIASIAARFIFPPLSAPLAGIAIGLLSTKLVIKVLRPYNYVPLINLKYEACQLSEKYPKLRTISFIFAICVSILSKTLGTSCGIALGIYSAIILDVENYKSLQKESRKSPLEKGLY